MDLSDAALRERAFNNCADLRCFVTNGLIRPETWTEDCQCDSCFTVKHVWAGYIALRDATRADLAIPCQRHGCMWDAPEAHEAPETNRRRDPARRGEVMETALTERRAVFVYEAARLAAIAAEAPIIPRQWIEREGDFRAQFLRVIEHQMGPQRSNSPEELHGSWTQAYDANGWVYGDAYDVDKRTHPDLVPYAQLEQREQDKDAVFVTLCEIARLYVR